jgi:hypothetical protein
MYGTALLVAHAPRDATALQVVRREFDLNLVTDADADVVLPHLATEMCKDLMTALEFDGEERVRKRFADDAIHRNLRLVDSALSASGLGRHHSRAIPRRSCGGVGPENECAGVRQRSFAIAEAYRLAATHATAVLWERPADGEW